MASTTYIAEFGKNFESVFFWPNHEQKFSTAAKDLNPAKAAKATVSAIQQS